MAIYYTRNEYGKIYWCPIKSQHSKIIKQLKRSNHLKGVGPIHSVFFAKNRIVKKIWDSGIHKYRTMNKNQKVIIPLGL